MSTQDLINDRALVDLKRLCYAGLDTTMLRQRVVQQIKRVVPFDASVAFTMDPLTGLITHALVDKMGDAKAVHFYLEHVYFEDDILEFNGMVRNRQTVGLLSEATGGKLERCLGYRELQAPLGWGYEVKAAFATGTQLWGGLCLTPSVAS